MLYLIILIVGAIASVIGPWWVLPLVAAVACAFKASSAKEAFAISALAGSTLWVAYAMILIFSGKENLVDKIGALFAGDSAFLSAIPSLGLILTIITLLASLTTGFGGLAGKHLSLLFRGK